MDENNRFNENADNGRYRVPDYNQSGYGQGENQRYGQSNAQSFSQSYNQDYGQNYGAPRMTPEEAPMTMGEWLVTLIVCMIPCIGIIMLFIWAFGSTGNVNRRNYCRAQLIVAAIGMVLMTLLWGIIGGVAASVIGTSMY